MEVYSNEGLKNAVRSVMRAFRHPISWLVLSIVGILLTLAFRPFLILAIGSMAMFVYRSWETKRKARTSENPEKREGKVYEYTFLFWLLLGLVSFFGALAVVGIFFSWLFLGCGLGCGIPLGFIFVIWFFSQKAIVVKKSLELRSVVEGISEAKRLLKGSIALDQDGYDRSELEKAARGLGVEAKSVEQTQQRLLDLTEKYGQLKSYLLYILYSPWWLIRPEEEYLEMLTGEEIRRPTPR